MSPEIFVNGFPQSHVDARDRGFQYGDGLFETMAVIDGRVRRQSWHLERLRLGCERLGILYPQAVLESELTQLLQSSQTNSTRAVLKLIVTRGLGGRGYGVTGQMQTTRVMWLDAWPSYPVEWREQGVEVRLCDTVLSDSPALAGLKHLNRLEQVLARREWQVQEIDTRAVPEGLMRDARGAIVCGTMTNVFIVQDGTMLTPSLQHCGVAGVTRRAVFAAAGELGIAARETSLDLSALEQAQEIFLTNALVGVWPVRRFTGREYAPGPITRRLQSAVE